MAKKGKYDHTINLPKPYLPMRAGLVKKEPEILKKWEEMKIYHRMLEARKDAPKFILHDGPPYANGDIHIGHALNKTLKDVTNKYRFLRGYKVLYVPGWDTHGLPIERAVEKKTGKKHDEVDPVEWRAQCKDMATHYINLQMQSFKRLGVFGDWENYYATFQPKFEAKELEVLYKLWKEGYVIRDLKPIYWCPHDKTALAEAEIEYREKKSPSIYVAFPPTGDVDFWPVIWTTTPWTLPANVGIAVAGDEGYVKVRFGERIYLVAEKRLADVAQAVGWKDYEVVGKVKGAQLEGIRVRHPVYKDKTSVIVTADFVSMEEGTGLVHTAPGHGEEDYWLAQKKGLPVISYLNDDGTFNEESGPFAGKFYTDVSEMVLQMLKDEGILLYQGEITHSYPHCWRCHNPVLFRAVEQWFIDVDKYREEALKALNDVKWVPEESVNRIRSMIEVRPNWCLSRQRLWGVPIPAVKCKHCGHVFMADEIFQKFIAVVKEEGTDAWFSHPVEDFLPEGMKCPKCGGTEFEKMTEVLDVWFDSGVSHAAVLEQWPDHEHPADLYLEGYDQHRGWFQTSLLTSVPYKGIPPYKTVVSHGFVLDESGRAMSKSLGNVIHPMDVVSKHGADILRYALMMLDYTADIMFGDTVIKGAIDAYRKLRNTFRFMEGNLYDFSLDKLVPWDQMLPLDRWIVWKFADVYQWILQAYDEYDYHSVHGRLLPFVSRTLSAVYLDAVKSRLYLKPTDSKERRSAQTALYLMAAPFVQLLAPILTFTAEDMWEALKVKGLVEEDSVFLSKFVEMKYEIGSQEEEAMEIALAIREIANAQIEKLRADKVIGHSLDAHVDVYLPQKDIEKLHDAALDLREMLIVSSVAMFAAEEMRVEVRRAEGHKCPRCWRIRTDIGVDPDYPDLCAECAADLKSMGL